MINAVIRFAIRFPAVVLAFATLLAGYGLFTLARAEFDAFPEFSPSLVTIQTEAPGLPAEFVETQVTRRIETTLAGVGGVQTIRSQSIPGLSVVTLLFPDGSNIYRNRQVVGERLALLSGQLPAGVASPTITPLTSSTSTTLGVGLTSTTRSLMDIRTFVDATLKPHLLSVPGVADVNVFGGEVRQWQIQVDPRKLVLHGLALQDVLGAARGASILQGAGFIETANQRLQVATDAQAVDPSDIARLPLLQKDGVSVALGDVATVALGPAPSISAAAVNGTPGVFLMVQAQYGASIAPVTRGVEQALVELRPALESAQIDVHPRLFRPADFIETAVGNVRFDVLAGAVLVMVVLFLFLFNVRTALISAVAIPVSLLGAVAVLETAGIGLNIMVLGGLAIAIGEVVDDAIIDMENIFRRLRENRGRERPAPPAQVILDASIEVRASVVYATFIVALVFYPLLTLGGVAGRLFAPLGLAYIAAVMVSLLVAMTVTPAMCYLLLATAPLASSDPPLFRALLPRYRRGLQRLERHPGAVFGALASVLALAIGLLPLFSVEFLPALKEGHYIVHMTAAPGTSQGESLRIGQQVARALAAVDGVQSVAQWVGRAPNGPDTAGSNYSEFEVEVGALPGKEQTRVLRQIRETLAGDGGGFPGVTFSVNTFLTERIDETVSGYSASLVVGVFGPALDHLNRDAAAIATALRTIPGVQDVQIQAPAGAPQVMIRPRPDRLRVWGLSPQVVADTVRTAYEGTPVGQIYEGTLSSNLVVMLAPGLRERVHEVGRLQVRTPDARLVPLSEIAELDVSSAHYRILHEGGRRLQTVTANVAGRDLEDVEAEAHGRIASSVQLGPGNYVVFTGTARAQARARTELLIHSAIALVGIVLLLYLALRNRRNVVLAFANLPFALVGGVLAVVATGSSISLGSMVGFVTLFGITLRNSIMLVSHYQHLVTVEALPWNADTAVRGAAERLPSILMTAVVTALGLLPLALGTGEPGREIEGPMATVIVGGLVTSALLNLLILPTLLSSFGRFGAKAEILPGPPDRPPAA